MYVFELHIKYKMLTTTT